MIDKTLKRLDMRNDPEFRMLKILERKLPICRGDNGFMTTKEALEKMMVSSSFADGEKWNFSYKTHLINNILDDITQKGLSIYFLDCKKENGKWYLRRKKAAAGQSERCTTAILSDTIVGTKYNSETLKEIIFNNSEFYGNIWSAERLANAILNNPIVFRSWVEDDGILYGIRLSVTGPVTDSVTQVESVPNNTSINLNDEQLKKIASYVVEGLVQRLVR